MIDLETYKKQHEEILIVITGIKGTIRQGNLERDADNIANQINILAGKLRIHLDAEDQFMYPSLLNSISLELKDLAKRYIEEMGNLRKEFIEYEECFNTRAKILSDSNKFLETTENMLKMLETRIEKEDKMLYPLI